MARQKAQTPYKTFITRDGFSIVLVGIILIVLAFLAVQTFPQIQEEREQDQKTQQSDKSPKENQIKQNTDTSKKETPKLTQKLPTEHTIAHGDSLWKLAVAYYNDGYKWPQIAAVNNLTDPDKLLLGSKLNIPAPTSQTVIPVIKTHNVVIGDTLWEISEKYYGSGFEWYKIRDANTAKVGLLPNGRPLITPGATLTIPNLN